MHNNTDHAADDHEDDRWFWWQSGFSQLKETDMWNKGEVFLFHSAVCHLISSVNLLKMIRVFLRCEKESGCYMLK